MKEIRIAATPPDPHPPAHTLRADEVAQRLGVHPSTGLGADEIAERRARHGPNELPQAAPRPVWLRVVDQFRDFMILVLLAAAVVAGLIGDASDTLVIVVIVVLNGAIGFWQAWTADRALQALQQMAALHATVRRQADGGGGGQVQVVATAQLVPGDVVLLEAGNLVPADLRLHEVAQLRVDESALTGESVTVDKSSAALRDPQLPVADRINIAFKGTLVTHGRATGLVVATGPRTELGQVATLLQGVPLKTTPLQQRLAAFGRWLSYAVLAICVLVFAIGVARGEPVLLMGLTAVSLAVAAIPEALPAIVTVLLAVGARRLVRANALVRRLAAVETLGSVTVICSDKTGTLTQNRMRVQRAHAADGDLPSLWAALALCNDAVPDHGHEDGAGIGGERADGGGDGASRWIGDPTETALLEAAAAAGLDVDVLRRGRPRRHEWPFDADRKRMSTLHPADGGGWCAYVKGAPESVLPRCVAGVGLDGAPALAQLWAAQGLRVLAVARRDGDAEVVALDADAFEQGLHWIGLVGLIDPPRPEARRSVAECLGAGIRPVMITGDHPATARAIARDLGIVGDDEAAVITGAELARLDDAALREAAGRVQVYARMDPAQKIRIVQALQARGDFVAMTGDGVNDAPALRSADIGVAMGKGGTDVAREASSLVLLDDNFATIVGAVREGRRIFDNIRKFIRYALTGNSGEIWLLFLAPLLGLPVPLLPIHILWVNLVTDGLPGLALAAEPAESRVMQRPPRPPKESVFAHGLWQHTLWVGLLIGVLCLGVQAWGLSAGGDLRQGEQTMVFTTITFAQMAHVLAIRSERDSLFTQGLFSNLPLLGAVALTVALQLAVVYVPALQRIFHTHALSAGELALCVAISALVFVVVEIEKAWRRRPGAVSAR